MFENEEWRVIEEKPSYSVSNYGRVKHEKRPLQCLKPIVNDRGFPVVILYGPASTRYPRQINKLVATTFLEPAQFYDQTAVWHIDGDLLNCNLDNLKWEMRSRVLAWNDQNRTRTPKIKTGPVVNHMTGVVYDNAFECAMAVGDLEETIFAKCYNGSPRYSFLDPKDQP